MVEARAQRAPQLQEVASVRREDGMTFPYFLDRGDPQLRELERQARTTLGQEWHDENTVRVGGTTFASENFHNLARAVGGEPVGFVYEGIHFHANGRTPGEGGFISIGGVKFYPERDIQDEPDGKPDTKEGRYGEVLQRLAEGVKPGNIDSRFNSHGLTDLEGLIFQSMGFTENKSPHISTLIEIAQTGNNSERKEAAGILAVHLLGMLIKMAYQFPEKTTASRLDLIQEGYLRILMAIPNLDVTKNPIRYMKKAARNAMRNLAYPPSSVRLDEQESGSSLDGFEEQERDELEFEVVEPNPTEKTAADTVERGWVGEVLFDALKQVRPSQKEVIVQLYGLEDGDVKTMPELAERRGVTKQEVNRVDKEVLKKLRAMPAVQDLAEALAG